MPQKVFLSGTGLAPQAPLFRGVEGSAAKRHSLQKNREFRSMDFQPLWPKLFSKSLYNLGTDSLNCLCCRPHNLTASNVLPSSVVEIEVLCDGLYFEPVSKEFSESFHSAKEFKDKRLRKQAEWGTQLLPIGPLNSGERLSLPLLEARQLLEQEKARLIEPRFLRWFCTKKESSLSRQLTGLLETLRSIDSELRELEKSCIQKFRLFYRSELEKNPRYTELLKLRSHLEKAYLTFPSRFTNPSSELFSPDLAVAFLSIQRQFLRKFRDFCESRGVRVHVDSNSRAFVRTSSPVSLAWDFSVSEFPQKTE